MEDMDAIVQEKAVADYVRTTMHDLMKDYFGKTNSYSSNCGYSSCGYGSGSQGAQSYGSKQSYN